MTRFGLSRRTRNFLLWTARLALVVYLVQLSAVDHWHAHAGDIVGVEGSSEHVQHCHGAGDCSSGGSAALSVYSEPTTLPVPPVQTTRLEQTSQPVPHAAFISPPSEPPRAA
jgi:hypothetical protein